MATRLLKIPAQIRCAGAQPILYNYFSGSVPPLPGKSKSKAPCNIFYRWGCCFVRAYSGIIALLSETLWLVSMEEAARNRMIDSFSLKIVMVLTHVTFYKAREAEIGAQASIIQVREDAVRCCPVKKREISYNADIVWARTGWVIPYAFIRS